MKQIDTNRPKAMDKERIGKFNAQMNCLNKELNKLSDEIMKAIPLLEKACKAISKRIKSEDSKQEPSTKHVGTL